jgi:hypothetical protein
MALSDEQPATIEQHRDDLPARPDLAAQLEAEAAARLAGLLDRPDLADLLESEAHGRLV